MDFQVNQHTTINSFQFIGNDTVNVMKFGQPQPYRKFIGLIGEKTVKGLQCVKTQNIYGLREVNNLALKGINLWFDSHVCNYTHLIKEQPISKVDFIKSVESDTKHSIERNQKIIRFALESDFNTIRKDENNDVFYTY